MVDAPSISDTVRLDTYRRLFTEARDMTNIAREAAKKRRRYYDGKEDEAIRKKLRAKNQPDFNINNVRIGVEGMVGVVERGKSDPRAYPRTPQDEGSSEVATDTLRYIVDQNRWQQNKLKVFRNMLIEGTSAVLIEVDDQLEVKLRRVRFEEFFFDPYSREPDFSDASYMGIAKWQYVDEIVSAYPEHEAALRLSSDRGDTVDSNFADRPDDATSTVWSDAKRKRMLIVEMYKRDRGIWLKCVFVGDLKLEEGESPYQDNDGRPCCPIEAASALIDDENNRYGPVQDMLGLQDMVNVYHRKAVHRATFRQVQETDPISAYADPEEVRREAARPDGVIPPGYSIVPDPGFQQDMAIVVAAQAAIERTQPNPAILGRQDAGQSGRAALIRQQAGLTELSYLYSGLDDLELRIYRQAWSRVRQFWQAPKFIRVTDDENAVKFLQINEPVYGDPEPVIDPTTGFPQYDPMTRQIVMRRPVIEVRNEVAKMGVDIIVDSTPDTANVQQEQYQSLVELAKVGALGPNPGPFLLKASSLPKKRELLEELEKAQQQTAAQPSPEQQAALELEFRQAQADIGKTEADTEKSRAAALKDISAVREQQMNALSGIIPTRF